MCNDSWRCDGCIHTVDKGCHSTVDITLHAHFAHHGQLWVWGFEALHKLGRWFCLAKRDRVMLLVRLDYRLTLVAGNESIRWSPRLPVSDRHNRSNGSEGVPLLVIATPNSLDTTLYSRWTMPAKIINFISVTRFTCDVSNHKPAVLNGTECHRKNLWNDRVI